MRFILFLCAVAVGLCAVFALADQRWNEAWFYLAIWAMCVGILVATREDG